MAVPSYAVIVWRPRTRVDETLDVLAAHGIAGMTGILFIGFVAQAAWNGVADGLFYGGGELLGDQALAALVAPIYAFVATYVLLRVLGSLMPLRATEHGGVHREWTSSSTARRPTSPARARSWSRRRPGSRRRCRWPIHAA